jgi:hypothetical protein
LKSDISHENAHIVLVSKLCVYSYLYVELKIRDNYENENPNPNPNPNLSGSAIICCNPGVFSGENKKRVKRGT